MGKGMGLYVRLGSGNVYNVSFALQADPGLDRHARFLDVALAPVTSLREQGCELTLKVRHSTFDKTAQRHSSTSYQRSPMKSALTSPSLSPIVRLVRKSRFLCCRSTSTKRNLLSPELQHI